MRKAKETKLTISRLREVMNFDPKTGVFTWAMNRKGIAAGDVAGCVKAGYRRIWIDYEMHQSSRLAWFYVHGEWPTRNLQFKDGNTDNAAINNLAYGETDSSDLKAKNAYSRKWRAANPEKRRAFQRKANYGVTQEQYEAMLLAQNGVCACCNKPETQFHRGNPLPLCVDHCHGGTGVRGLLCRSCNTGLGLFKDDINTLRRAAAYLEAHAAKPQTNVIPLAGRRIGSS